MRLTLDWLKTHLDTAASLDEITDRLAMLGLPVEEVIDRAAEFADFTVGHVIDARPHPNADRLKICTVDTGTGTVEVVCGAPNARAGMKGVFAPVGARLPGNGMLLKKAKIRGVESSGMLCSERELGLSDEHEGIIELADDAPIGAPYAEIAGLIDPVFEVELTPNRGDCASVRGIARDLAAAGLGKLKKLDNPAVEGTFESPISWRRDLPEGAGDACPLVVGRYFRNLKNGDSPAWLQDRLRAVGLRPISALVDITNFVTLDLGRPLHVFDADRIEGDLVMRLAAAGESLEALDGKSYELDADTVVIADDARVHGIGGVMGGEFSGCVAETTNVFLEVALFDPLRIAATGRRLSILSDARYRFERGVDPTSALWGAEVAARLINECCGGEVSGLTVAGEMPDVKRTVELRTERLATLGGADVPKGDAARILTALGFDAKESKGVIRATVPTWRPDIDGEADLVEEVIRVFGYDNIPAVPMMRVGVVPKPVRTPRQSRTEHVRRALAARGLVESVTYSFLPATHATLFGGGAPELTLVNPISADLDVMRPGLIPNLVDAIRRNRARGMADISLFEVGPQYADDTPEGQALIAAGARAGNAAMRHWAGPTRLVDAFDAKADALAALAAAGAPTASLQVTSDAPQWYHPGRSGTLGLGPNALAYFGELHPATASAMDIDGPVAVFEVFLDRVPEPGSKPGPARKLLHLAPFQAVVRDFAFVVDGDMAVAKAVRAAHAADKKLIQDVSVFDVFEGAGVGEGKKSFAISVTMQPTEATMTDPEIEAVCDRITNAVAKATGGVLRG
jgi:phenylalanyl-tRNA synthetase beta chain